MGYTKRNFTQESNERAVDLNVARKVALNYKSTHIFGIAKTIDYFILNIVTVLFIIQLYTVRIFFQILYRNLI